MKRIIDIIVDRLVYLAYSHVILKERRRVFKIVYDGEFYSVKERFFLFWRDLHEDRTFLRPHRVPIVASALVKRRTCEEAADWLRRRYGRKARIFVQPPA